MIYSYVTKQESPIYHIMKAGRIYSLCGVWVKTGKFISPEPPEGKKECRMCAKVLQGQADSSARTP